MSGWVVDTCVLIDVLDDDPQFGRSSAAALDSRRGEGLVLCPVSYIELAPAFEGRRDLQEHFLSTVGIDFDEPWSHRDSVAAHRGWNLHVEARRTGFAEKRPLTDILIGAFASRFQGLLTRNPADFRTGFPDLPIDVP